MAFLRYVDGFEDLCDEMRTSMAKEHYFPGINFFGESKQEIIETVRCCREEFGFDIGQPRENCITSVDMLILKFYDTWTAEAHTITIHPIDDVEVHLPANMYIYLQECIAMHKQLRRANLYELKTNIHQIVFIPERAMRALRAYDWSCLEDQMHAWERERASALRQMSKHPNIGLHQPKKRTLH